MKATAWIALGPVVLTAASLCWAEQSGRASSQRLDFTWRQSLPLHSGDPRITAIGGTELRALATLDTKLFAAVGYWMDTATSSPALPGAQVLRLDDANAQWQVDLELTDRVSSGARKYQAISTLQQVRFTIDKRGARLAQPADLLLAGVWKRDLGLDVLSRVAGSGLYRWSRTAIPGQEAAPQGTQLRAFSLHKDHVTGVEIVFAGATNAIFAGRYNAERKNIDWNPQPEWRGDAGAAHPSAMARVASLADCNRKLYATAHGAIFERSDGASATWHKVFETTIHLPNPRVTGLRGLTCMRRGSGSPDFLLTAVEDSPSRIYRIDPGEIDVDGQYRATLELDVSNFLTKTLGTETTYAIAAYNNMTEYPDSAAACPYLLIGVEAITPQVTAWFGQRQHFNPHAYYLVRDCEGHYALRAIRDDQIEPEPQLVSVRTLAVSPFQTDPPGTVYAGGFDANYNPVHNTAWLYRGVPTAR